jgi:ribonuclease P/MRP protein subunit RPP40
VKYNNALSDQLPVTSGVPQGSVFGPLLFNVYINDLLQNLPNGSCIAYADDVTLVTSGKTLNDVTLQLQKLLDHVSAWAKLNRLSFSYSKCNVMFIPISSRAFPLKLQTLSLDDKPLSAVNHMTILGVYISHDLSWTRQALKTCGKISGRLAVLRRLGWSMNVNARRQVFNGFVRSRMTYCLPVWGNTSVSCQHLFDKLLVKAARFILNDPNAQLDARVSESTGMCNFKLHVLISNATTVFNFLSAKAPDRFCHLNLLADTQTRHSRATTGSKLEHIIHKRACDSLCFKSAAVADWSRLPNKRNFLQKLRYVYEPSQAYYYCTNVGLSFSHFVIYN